MGFAEIDAALVEKYGSLGAWIVDGVCMEPRYMDGETVIVSGGAPVTPGCGIVFRVTRSGHVGAPTLGVVDDVVAGEFYEVSNGKGNWIVTQPDVIGVVVATA